MLIISPQAFVSPHARIDDSERGSRLIVEADVFIDDLVKIRFAGGSADIVIERGARINAGCVIYSGHGVRIGRDARVSANTTIFGAEHAVADRERPIWAQGFLPSRGGVTVGSGAWVGANCVLLDGAVLGEGAVLRPGSVLDGAVPAYAIAAGNPAVVTGAR